MDGHGTEVTSSKPRPNSKLKGATAVATSHKLNRKLSLSPEEDGSVVLDKHKRNNKHKLKVATGHKSVKNCPLISLRILPINHQRLKRYHLNDPKI